MEVLGIISNEDVTTFDCGSSNQEIEFINPVSLLFQEGFYLSINGKGR